MKEFLVQSWDPVYIIHNRAYKVEVKLWRFNFVNFEEYFRLRDAHVMFEFYVYISAIIMIIVHMWELIVVSKVIT